MDVVNLLAALETERDSTAARLSALDQAIAAVRGLGAPPPPAREVKRKAAPVTRKARSVNRGRRKAKADPVARKAEKRGAREAPDSPRPLRGRMPSKDIEAFACETDAQRLEKVTELRGRGFVRAAPNVRLEPGTYDVREGRDGATVLWHPLAEAAGS